MLSILTYASSRDVWITHGPGGSMRLVVICQGRPGSGLRAGNEPGRTGETPIRPASNKPTGQSTVAYPSQLRNRGGQWRTTQEVVLAATGLSAGVGSAAS